MSTHLSLFETLFEGDELHVAFCHNGTTIDSRVILRHCLHQTTCTLKSNATADILDCFGLVASQRNRMKRRHVD